MPNAYVRHPEDRKRQEGHRTLRVPVARWSDPFLGMQGSSIEKMVMVEMARRGIYFQHSTTQNFVGHGVDPAWKADFLSPQYKIWMEIQGAYFHTLPGAVERDALRFAIVQAAGWRPIFWWEDDIRTRLIEIADAVPEFYRVSAKKNAPNKNLPRTKGYAFFEGVAPDTLKGLRSALSGRARPPQKLVKKVRKKRKKK